MKKILAITLLFVLVFGICAFAADDITVLVNGEKVAFDTPPVIENGRTLVPLRAVAESLGADVDWDGVTRTVTLTKGLLRVALVVGEAEMTVGGAIRVLDVPSKIESGRTLVPLRAISEAFGADVDWDGETRTVSITQSEDDSKVLRVVTNAEFPPFEWVENGAVVGADIDIINEIGKRLGMEVEITDVDFYSVLNGIIHGKYDLAISGITATDLRSDYMDFTSDYYSLAQLLVVKSGNGVSSLKSLDGETVAALEGSIAEQALLDYGFDYGYAVRSFRTPDDAAAALKNGSVAALLLDSVAAQMLVEKDGALKILDGEVSRDSYAIAIPFGNDELLAHVNAALDEMKKDGTLAKIFEKYGLAYEK